MKKLIIEVDGGIIQNVFSDSDLDILIIDRDLEGALDSEIEAEAYIEQFLGNSKLTSKEFKNIIYEGKIRTS